MNANLQELITKLETAAQAGADLKEQLILRTLRLPEVQDKIGALLDKQYSLISVEPLPSPLSEVTQVLLQFLPPPGSALARIPSIIATMASRTGEFLSVSEQVSLSLTAMPRMGALPFALTTASFTDATALPDDDPALIASAARRSAFAQEITGGSTFIGIPPTHHTTTEPTQYQSSRQTAVDTWGITTPNDNDTRTDYRTDYETDWKSDVKDDTD